MHSQQAIDSGAVPQQASTASTPQLHPHRVGQAATAHTSRSIKSVCESSRLFAASKRRFNIQVDLILRLNPSVNRTKFDQVPPLNQLRRSFFPIVPQFCDDANRLRLRPRLAPTRRLDASQSLHCSLNQRVIHAIAFALQRLLGILASLFFSRASLSSAGLVLRCIGDVNSLESETQQCARIGCDVTSRPPSEILDPL